jgi:protein-tyrosine phosphatase
VESRGRFPDHEAISYHHLPLTDTIPGAEDLSAWEDASFVARRYASYLDGDASGVGVTLRLLADPANLPAVFHCSVGKDRTGVLAAVVLGLLGVPEDVIVEDYALSADAMVQVLARFEREYPESADIVARFAPVILSVEPASMIGFLHGVRERFGDFDGLASALGLAQAVARLRAELLEPAP